MNYREVAKKLRKFGCVIKPRRSGGSHRKWNNPKNNKIAVIPDHGSRDIEEGTLRNAIKSLGLSWKDFKKA